MYNMKLVTFCVIFFIEFFSEGLCLMCLTCNSTSVSSRCREGRKGRLVRKMNSCYGHTAQCYSAALVNDFGEAYFERGCSVEKDVCKDDLEDSYLEYCKTCKTKYCNYDFMKLDQEVEDYLKENEKNSITTTTRKPQKHPLITTLNGKEDTPSVRTTEKPSSNTGTIYHETINYKNVTWQTEENYTLTTTEQITNTTLKIEKDITNATRTESYKYESTTYRNIESENEEQTVVYEHDTSVATSTSDATFTETASTWVADTSQLDIREIISEPPTGLTNTLDSASNSTENYTAFSNTSALNAVGYVSSTDEDILLNIKEMESTNNNTAKENNVTDNYNYETTSSVVNILLNIKKQQDNITVELSTENNKIINGN